MPASTRGQLRYQRVFVKINNSLGFGWNTADLSQAAGVSNADLKTGLGHLSETEAMAASALVLVTGANAPKPARVTKRLRNAPIGTRATLSTYCSFDKLAAAAALGFRLSSPARPSPTLRPFNTTVRSATGVVTLSNGLLCAMSLDPSVLTPNLMTQLGIEERTNVSPTERLRVVRGARSKPGRVQITLENGILAQLPFSTAKEDDAASVGTVIKREIVEYPAAAPVVPG
jgi:hypothetical protein